MTVTLENRTKSDLSNSREVLKMKFVGAWSYNTNRNNM